MSIPDEQRRDLERRANVQGVGVDPETGDVIVFVTEKVDLDDLDDEDVVPERVLDDAGRERVTNVVPTGDLWREDARGPVRRSPRILQAENRKRRYAEIPAGVSCGHTSITAGTWGSPPLSLGSLRRPVVGTNAHVAAPVGDSEPNDSILQPGPADGGQESDDHAARLVSASDIDPDGDNKTDIAFVEPDRDVTPDILGLSRPLVGFGEPQAEDMVAKSGRTTDVTEGSLVARDVSINVKGYVPNERVRFVGIDAYTPMSQGGDSGSLMVASRDEGLVGVGFLFAGGPQATLAIPFENVEDEFGEVELFGDPPEDPGEPGEDLDGGGFLDRVLRGLARLWPF